MARKRAANRSATRRKPPAPPRDPWIEAYRAQNPDAPAEEVERLRRMRQPVEGLERLSEIGRALADLEAKRAELVAERDALVLELRAKGQTWKGLAAAAGVSHATLIQRRG